LQGVHYVNLIMTTIAVQDPNWKCFCFASF